MTSFSHNGKNLAYHVKAEQLQDLLLVLVRIDNFFLLACYEGIPKGDRTHPTLIRAERQR